MNNNCRALLVFLVLNQEHEWKVISKMYICVVRDSILYVAITFHPTWIVSSCVTVWVCKKQVPGWYCALWNLVREFWILFEALYLMAINEVIYLKPSLKLH